MIWAPWQTCRYVAIFMRLGMRVCDRIHLVGQARLEVVQHVPRDLFTLSSIAAVS